MFIKSLFSLGIVAVACFTVFKMRGNPSKRPTDDEDENTRYLYNSVLLGGILLWPLIFDLCVGLKNLIHQPRILFGFFWMPLIVTLDMVFVEINNSKGDFMHHELSRDTSTIISAAFAMGSLFYASQKNYSSTHIIMYALLLCIAFIVPTISVPTNTKQAALVRSIQKVALNYAIGFVICGISVDLLKNVFPDKLNAVQPKTVRTVEE